MKTIPTLLLLIFLTACSSNKLSTQISEESNDFFKEESFLRFDEKRLTNMSSEAPCFGGNIIDDLQTLRNKLDQRKDEPHYWNQIATCYYLNKQLTKAEYYYQLSLDAAKKSHQVYYPALNNLGLLNLSLGHHLSARSYFRKALKNNRYLTPRYNLALIHLKYNKPKMAIKLLTRFTKKQSGDPDLNFNLAFSHYLLAQYKKAAMYLNKMETQKKRSDAIYLQAIMLYDQQKYEEAINLIESQKVKISAFYKTNSILRELAEKKIIKLEELAEERENAKELLKNKPKVSVK